MTEPTEPTQPAPTTDAPDKRPWWKKKRFIIPIAVVLFIALVGSLADPVDETEVASDDETTTTTQREGDEAGVPNEPEVTTTTEAPATTTTASPHTTFKDGTHRVGSDIQPGTYRLRTSPRSCYWERLAGFSGEFGDIKANENESGPAIVTILPEDAGFTSRGCGTWTSDLSQLTDSQTNFGEGTWQVGVDIAPGTYRNSGGGSCYWERLSGFSGEFGDIIANDNVEGQGVVTIAASDKGFRSRGCGDWSA